MDIAPELLDVFHAIGRTIAGPICLYEDFMPTVAQLPEATAVNSTDQILIDQNGVSITATVVQLLGSTQPALTLASDSLLGRVSPLVGGPEAVGIGPGVQLSRGALQADMSVMAPLASPAFSGIPTAPAPAANDSSSQLATTEFVMTSGRLLTLTGDVTGSGNSNIQATLRAITAPGTFDKVTVNAKGLVTAGAALAAADVTGALGYMPYDANNPANYATQAWVAGQKYATGFAGQDASAALVVATAGTTARTLAARTADCINILDFGADPTGSSDITPALDAAAQSVPSGGSGEIVLPRGTYKLATQWLSSVAAPGRTVSVRFESGAVLAGGASIVADVVYATNAGYDTTVMGGQSFCGLGPILGSVCADIPFSSCTIENNSANSNAARSGKMTNYINNLYYGKYRNGTEPFLYDNLTWNRFYDGSAGWKFLDVIQGPAIDEDAAARGNLSTDIKVGESDLVSLTADAGWDVTAGNSIATQGHALAAWAMNGLQADETQNTIMVHGGHVFNGFSIAGGYNGESGTGQVNRRATSYPAVFGDNTNAMVTQNATVTVTLDVTAKASANVSGGQIVGLTVSSGGAGLYTSAPTVTIAAPNSGQQATATPVISNGFLTGIVVTNPGSGYSASSSPPVTISGGGVPVATAVSVTLNPDGAHGDIASVAAAINATAIPYVRAMVNTYGADQRLVLFSTAPNDLGVLTINDGVGSPLAALGISPGTYSTLRDAMAVVISTAVGTSSSGDEINVNGVTISINGTMAAVASAINAATIPGVTADTNAGGLLVLMAQVLPSPCAPAPNGGIAAGGLQITDVVSGSLSRLNLTAGVYLPPAPPHALAAAYGEFGTVAQSAGSAFTVTATDPSGASYGPVTIALAGFIVSATYGSGQNSVVLSTVPAGVTGSGSGGVSISGPGIPGGTVVTYVRGTSVGLSQNTTAAGSAASLTVAGGGTAQDIVGCVCNALTAAGWWSPNTGTVASLTSAPKIVTAYVRGDSDTSVVIRNTAGGTLTLQNTIGTPLAIFGITLASAITYKPGAYGAGFLNGFVAEPDSIAPNGRSFLAYGSTTADQSVWPNNPLQAAGNFLHGIRTDTATVADGIALRAAQGQKIALDAAGNIWVQEDATGKVVVGTGSTRLFSIDATGNVVAKGTLTFNGTP